MSLILWGKPAATALEGQLRHQLQAEPQPLTMGIMLVGNDARSLSYIKRKQLSAQSLGIKVNLLHLPTSATTEDLCEHVTKWNNDPHMTGFIIQLPLPSHIDTRTALEKICPYKDIDGLNAWSLGKLTQHQALLVPATAKGILSLLHYYHISLSGKHVVVVGRPTGCVFFVRLVTPDRPVRTLTTGEHLQVRTWAAVGDQPVLFIRLA